MILLVDFGSMDLIPWKSTSLPFKKRNSFTTNCAIASIFISFIYFEVILRQFLFELNHAVCISFREYKVGWPTYCMIFIISLCSKQIICRFTTAEKKWNFVYIRHLTKNTELIFYLLMKTNFELNCWESNELVSGKKLKMGLYIIRKDCHLLHVHYQLCFSTWCNG